MDCIIVRLIDLPETVHGVTRRDAEGDYNVYINARLSADGRVAAYRHEMEHIRLGHFYDDRPVAEKENEAEHGHSEKAAVGSLADPGLPGKR